MNRETETANRDQTGTKLAQGGMAILPEIAGRSVAAKENFGSRGSPIEGAANGGVTDAEWAEAVVIAAALRAGALPTAPMRSRETGVAGTAFAPVPCADGLRR
jgi:hypothetical protein